MMASKALCAAALLASSTLAFAEEKRLEAKSEEDRKTVVVLESLKVSLNFDDTQLGEVLSFLREVTQLNILASRGVMEKGEEIQVSLKVDELRLKDALGLICEMVDLDYKLEDGVIMVITKDEKKSDTYLELYDVRDLLFHLRDFKAPEISLVEPGDEAVGIVTTEAGDETGSLEDPTLLVELIKNHTGGTSWNDNPRCSVDIQNGILVVVQTKEGHQQVSRLVEKLRQYK